MALSREKVVSASIGALTGWLLGGPFMASTGALLGASLVADPVPATRELGAYEFTVTEPGGKGMTTVLVGLAVVGAVAILGGTLWAGKGR